MARVRVRLLAGLLLAALLACAGTPASASARRGPSVSGALSALLASSQIDKATYSQDLATYVSAKHALGALTGTRRSELGAVIANVQAIAAAGQLSASRLAVTFLTLDRNRQWWTTEALLSGSQRVSFPDSEIVWQHYPGQGIEIQWLGTFGGQRDVRGQRKHAPAPAARRSDRARRASAPEGSRGSTCSDFDGGVPPGRAGSCKGPRYSCSRGPTRAQGTRLPDGGPAGARDLPARPLRRGARGGAGGGAVTRSTPSPPATGS